MVIFARAFHISGPVPGAILRTCLERYSPAPTFNPRRPLIPDSEKKNLCDALADSYLEALSGFLGGIEISAERRDSLVEQFHLHGLDLLDLARIHEGAVRRLDGSGDAVEKGRAFFTGIAAAVSSDLTTGARVESLARQVGELVISNQQLREEVNRRKVIEDSLRHREKAASEMLEKSREMQDEWRLLSRRLLSVQEDEQKLISRELHDVIAQTMTGINVRLAVLRSQATANAIELHRKIAEAEKLAEKSVEIVHQFASELHPAVLDDFGLIPALRTFVEAFSARSGVQVEITAESGADDLPASISTALYRIAREALGNIARRAVASHAVVKISCSESLVRLEITDDGGGSEAAHEDDPDARLGLLGMRERAGMVGGIFKVESHPGVETTISVEIPFTESAADLALKKMPVSTPSLT